MMCQKIIYNFEQRVSEVDLFKYFKSRRLKNNTMCIYLENIGGRDLLLPLPPLGYAQTAPDFIEIPDSIV